MAVTGVHLGAPSLGCTGMSSAAEDIRASRHGGTGSRGHRSVGSAVSLDRRKSALVKRAIFSAKTRRATGVGTLQQQRKNEDPAKRVKS